MMSLINTNHSYLKTMQIAGDSPIVGVIVSVYYLGCAVGAVVASKAADRSGRKVSIFACLAMTILGSMVMFVSGLSIKGSSPWNGGALWSMLAGRIVLGLGVGGIDAVIPVYSSELTSDNSRGKALAQEFQMNIFGLLMAYSINLGVTSSLGKHSQWAWRIPIIVMKIFPILLLSFISQLPETPRWFMSQERQDDAKRALESVHGKDIAKSKLEELAKAHSEESDKAVTYTDMLLPGRSQFHPTMVTVMGQVNQALTGYGAVSVYGPQIFELLGFQERTAQYLTLGNYVSYFLLMTLAWVSIDRLGRRKLMVWGAVGLASCFAILTIFGGLAANFPKIPDLVVEIPGSLTLFVATGIFGIGWLATVWLIPTEIYPNSARAQGSAISVIIWGLANFTVTLLTPIGFNNLKYWLFLGFAFTNAFAGWWTWKYSPETGRRSFEENQEFFNRAQEDNSWVVKKVNGGKFKKMPNVRREGVNDGERSPLLRRHI
jgi:sugar porter (SP) family MFS transporter